MILYQLLCHKGHDFEAWFCDSGTYDQQVVAGDVSTDGLGLSEADRATFTSSDVVIHSAATVSFDSPLDGGDELSRYPATADLARKVKALAWRRLDV